MTALLPPNVKVHLALGFIDMRKGIDGLAMLVQGVLQQDPFTGHLFVFRGRTRANRCQTLFAAGTNDWRRTLPAAGNALGATHWRRNMEKKIAGLLGR